MTVIPHPAMQLDQKVSETASMLAVIRSLAENVEDDEWCARRADIVALLYLTDDKLRAADKPIARLLKRRATS